MPVPGWKSRLSAIRSSGLPATNRLTTGRWPPGNAVSGVASSVRQSVSPHWRGLIVAGVVPARPELAGGPGDRVEVHVLRSVEAGVAAGGGAPPRRDRRSVGLAGVVSGTHLPSPRLVPWPKSPKLRPAEPRRSTETEPAASGDSARLAIAAPPPNAVAGHELVDAAARLAVRRSKLVAVVGRAVGQADDALEAQLAERRCGRRCSRRRRRWWHRSSGRCARRRCRADRCSS